MDHKKLYEYGCKCTTLFFFLRIDCAISNYFPSLSGLPYFSPDLAAIMSSNTYASSFKNLGGAYWTKGATSNLAGGSWSGAHREDGAESITPVVRNDAVSEQLSAEFILAEHQETGERPRVKRIRTVGKKSARPQNVPLDD